MNKFTALFYMIVLASMSTLHAQKSNVNYDELKGVEYYNRWDIKDAIKFFEGLIKSDSSSAEHHFWLGKCYETTAQKDKELVHYLKARQLNPKISPDILYRIAKAYHQGFFFDDAIKYYKMYKKDINDAGAAAMKSSIMKEHIRASKRIHECENAKIMVANAYSHKIYHLSGVLNSEYPEYTPSVSADNKKMLFTSRRPGGTSEDKDKDNGNFEDVWMSVKDENGEWSSPQNVGSPVNTISHDACVSMDATGKELFLYKTSNGGDIYFSILENGNWSKPDALKQVNSKFKEPSVTISSNGRTIFFSSDRPGGFGGLDIYRTDKNKDGNWSEAENLGSVVNSEYDEDSPYISPDNKTLYFSSNGHNNMGGYDIFSAAYDVKKRFWGKPLNIGFPINSPDDDIYFAIAGDHRTAYFASEKKDGFGEKDIYMILIDSTYISKPLLSVDMGGVAPLHVASVHPSALKMHEGKYDSKSHAVPTNKAATDSKPNSPTAATAIAVASTIKGEVVEYRGRVLDENGQPIVSIIMVKNENSTEAAKSYKTQPDGTFVILLEKGFDYGIDIEKDGYIFSSNNIDLTKEAKVLPKLQEKIVLKKPTLGAKIILKNIAYASGSASLEPESFVEIDILSEFLVKNPTIKIEISGHTDNKGTAEVNKELSTARAKSVYKLLVKKGIIPERLKYVGYGSDRSIANNDTEAGRQLNRRTEFEIIYR